MKNKNEFTPGKIKFGEQMINNKKFSMYLNEEGAERLASITDPIELKATKRALFNIMFGIAEVTLSLHILTDESNANIDGHISNTLKDDLYYLGGIYDVIDNIEYEEEGGENE